MLLEVKTNAIKMDRFVPLWHLSQFSDAVRTLILEINNLLKKKPFLTNYWKKQSCAVVNRNALPTHTCTVHSAPWRPSSKMQISGLDEKHILSFAKYIALFSGLQSKAVYWMRNRKRKTSPSIETHRAQASELAPALALTLAPTSAEASAPTSVRVSAAPLKYEIQLWCELSPLSQY